jgi:TonB dependent receptor
MMLDTTVGLHGRSKYFDSDNQSPLFGRQKGYSKLDARVQYGPMDERWHLALVGKNLTDEKTTGSAFNLPFPITAARDHVSGRDPQHLHRRGRAVLMRRWAGRPGLPMMPGCRCVSRAR